MRIGVPREIKEMENRVGVTPAGVSELVRDGHQVFIETNAGVGSGFSNQEYKEAGASDTGVFFSLSVTSSIPNSKPLPLISPTKG